MRTETGWRSVLAAGAVVLAAAAPLGAQGASLASVDPRWQAFIGCWEPVGPDGTTITDAKSATVCVIPTAGRSAVDVVTVQGGKVNTQSRVDATGERHPIGRDGCTGMERAAWSADGQRVYLSADITCNGVARRTSGLLAFSPTGEWMDVQGVTAGRNTSVHVTRYRPMAGVAGLPDTVTRALAASGATGNALAVSTARLAASATVAPVAVVDATRHVDMQVVEAWLLENAQGFTLDARQLVALADAGVPGRVTDLMVALSFPREFAVNGSSRDADRAVEERQTVASGRTIPIYVDSYGYSPFGWSAYSPYYYGYNYGRYGYGYGYNNGWYFGNQPIIVNRGSASPGGITGQSRPRVVNGRGYSSGGSSSAPSSSSSGSSGSSSSSGGSSSSGSSSSGSSSSGSSSSGSSSSGSSSSGSSGSSSGSSTGRTAKPRSP